MSGVLHYVFGGVAAPDVLPERLGTVVDVVADLQPGERVCVGTAFPELPGAERAWEMDFERDGRKPVLVWREGGPVRLWWVA